MQAAAAVVVKVSQYKYYANKLHFFILMQVLLASLNSKYIHTNTAIRLLYQLNKDFNKLSWKEFTIKEDKDEIANYCSNYDIVAFSCYIWNITQTLDVCKLIKQLNPNCKILLGGPEVSYEWEQIIVLNFIDYIIIGEGEIPFQSFLKNYPNVEKTTGLAFKKNNNIHYIPNNTVFDISTCEDLKLYENDNAEALFNKILYIETSRGCPYKCEFCLASLDNKVRYFPMKMIENNLLQMMKNGRVIKFLDRTFNMKRDFTLHIFQFILDNYTPQNIFQFEITADILHPDIILFINEKVPKNLFRFEIGIQTVNKAANLAVQRKQDFEKTKSIIKQVEKKVELHLDLIVGLPLDYFDDIKYSFNQTFKLFAPELQLGFLKFLKGTPMRQKINEHQFTYDSNPPYQIISSKYLSQNELTQILHLENALEIYWNKKRATNTLRYISLYYDAFDFLTTLGTFFKTENVKQHYTLLEIYQSIYNCLKKTFLNDKIVFQLLALDYFLSQKVKPKNFFLHSIEVIDIEILPENVILNLKKYRYIAFNIDFDIDFWLEDNEIISKNNCIVIQYSGTKNPEIIYPKIKSLETINVL
jgi:anaerobic magnesium-protoporphyrin IX monomethyl ester cyclase